MSRRDEEFERVALPHARSLLRFALRLTRNSPLAEDLAQEALMRAWRAFDSLRSQEQVRAWLFRILFNAYRSYERKDRPASLDLHSAKDIPSAPDFDSLEVMQALERLSADHRTVLLLAAAEGFTCREIAEILSIPIGTAMSRLSRARENMRAALGQKEMAPR